MNDPWDDPEVQRWREHCERELAPMIESSAMTIAINPDEPDAKSAVELGYSILMGKPIIVVSPPGRKISRGLRRVADAIIVGSPGDPEARRQMADAIERLGLSSN